MCLLQTIHGDASARGLNTSLAALNDYAKVDFLNAPLVVIVTSTTGNGDPPNNAEEFWRFVRKRTHPKDLLSKTSFAVLGLGDTNYDKFCAAAKTIHKRLTELGGSEFYKMGLADESMGLDSVVDPWIKGLWPAIAAAAAAATETSSSSANVSAQAPPAVNGQATATSPPTTTAAATSAAASDAASNNSTATTTAITTGRPPLAPANVDSSDNAVAAAHSPMSMIRAVTAARAQAEAYRQGQRRASQEDAAGALVHPPQHPSHNNSNSSSSTHAAEADDSTTSMAAAVVRSQTSSATIAAVAAAEAAVARGEGSGMVQADVLEQAAQAAAHAASEALLVAKAKREQERQALPASTAGQKLESTESLQLPVPALTPGVRSVQQVFPSLAIPPADVTAAGKFMPKLPPVTWAVRKLDGSEAAAAAAAEVKDAYQSVGVRSNSASSVASSASTSGSLPSPDVTATTAQLQRLPSGLDSVPTSPCRSAAPAPAASGAAAGGGGVMSLLGPGRCLDAPVPVPVARATYLTSGGASSSRRVVHCELDVSGTVLEGAWSPGDAIGVIAPNPRDLVQWLCARLGLQPGERLAITPAASTVAASSSSNCSGGSSIGAEFASRTPLPSPSPGTPGFSLGPAASGGSGEGGGIVTPTPSPIAAPSTLVPSWLTSLHGQGWVPTAADVLTWAVDLTSPPKKALVRLLAEHASSQADRDCLMFLCSRAPGAAEAWSSVIEAQRLHLLDVLCMFPSCAPPLPALLSALPQLPPRYYSISCSSLANPRLISFAFTVVQYHLPAVSSAQSAGSDSPSSPSAAAEPVTPGLTTPASPPVDRSSSTSSGDVVAITRRGVATTWLEGLCGHLQMSGHGASSLSSSSSSRAATPLQGGRASRAAQASATIQPVPLTPAALEIDDCSTPAAVAPAHSSVSAVSSVSLDLLVPAVSDALSPVNASAATADAAAGLPSPGTASAAAEAAAAPYPPALAATRSSRAAADLEAIHRTTADANGGGGSSNGSAGSSAAPVLRVFLRPTRDFLLPASPERPVIMIGPGTGVAPFRGFLQHRRARLAKDAGGAIAVCKGWWRPGCRFAGSLREDADFHTPLTLGPAHLFFGNRSPEVDYLYRDDLEGFLSDGALTRLHTAWSRPGPGGETAPDGGKLYVQHRLAQAGRTIAELLLLGGGGAGGGAHLYVCGDGAKMAKDVHSALVALLVRHGADVAASANVGAPSSSSSADSTTPRSGSGGSSSNDASSSSSTPGNAAASACVPVITIEAQAQEFLAALAKRGRYVRDIWS